MGALDTSIVCPEKYSHCAPAHSFPSQGALCVASWFNSILWTIELQQAHRYFTTYSDELSIRIMVGTMMVIDAAGSLGLFTCVYLYCISHWGDMAYLINQNGTFSFMLAGTLLCAGFLLKYHLYADRHKVAVTVIIWIGGSAAADIVIAITLVTLLHLAKKKTTAGFHASTLAGPLRRLSRAALESGAVPASWTLVALAIFFWNQDLDIGNGLTLLYNLNLRKISANTVFNSGGQLSGSGPVQQSGAFQKPGNKNKTQTGAGTGIGVSTYTEQRHDRDDEEGVVQVVTLPVDAMVSLSDILTESTQFYLYPQYQGYDTAEKAGLGAFQDPNEGAPGFSTYK
ncbi:hypothetical protein P7C70_g7051, partial [Phenoliferia sp. Uapishka_3]